MHKGSDLILSFDLRAATLNFRFVASDNVGAFQRLNLNRKRDRLQTSKSFEFIQIQPAKRILPASEAKNAFLRRDV